MQPPGTGEPPPRRAGPGTAYRTRRRTPGLPAPGRVCHDWLLRTLREADCEPDIAHQADENPTLVALVAAGLGIALIPRLGRGPLPDGVVEGALDPTPVRHLYALWRPGAARRPAIAETVRTLQEHWPRVSGG